MAVVQQQVAEMPMIKNNLYKLDAWVNPFADVQELHRQAMIQSKEKF